MMRRCVYVLVLTFFVITLHVEDGLAVSETDSPPVSFTALPKGCFVQNCGFDCACFILNHYGKRVDVTLLVDRLKIGEQMSEATSFLRLQSVFSDSNLYAKGYKVEKIAEIFDAISVSRAAIIHLTDGTDQHFAVMYRGKDGLLTLFDYPHEELSFEANHIPAALIARMTNNVLYVDNAIESPLVTLQSLQGTEYKTGSADHIAPIQSKSNSQSGELLSMSKSIACDPSTLVDGVLFVHLPVKNIGLASVSIFKAHGACGCFKGMQPESAVILPGETCDLAFRFLGAQFNKSSGTQIAFETSDPKLPICTVRVTPEHSERQDGKILIPFSTANLGGSDINTLSQRTVKFAILSKEKPESEFRIARISYDKTILNVQVSYSDETFGDIAWIKINIAVSLKQDVKSGRFDIPIVLSTTYDSNVDHTLSVSGCVFQ